MSNKTYIQEFEVKDDGIHIRSTSGNSYLITKTSCSCKGFGFRKTCGHYEEAKSNDLLSLIPTHTTQQKIYHKLSQQAIQSRKDAIKRYLTKNAIPSNETIINELEKVVTQDMKPQKFLEKAKKLVSLLNRK